MIILILLAAVSSQCPDRTGNHGTINYCAQRELDKANVRLNLRWKRTLKISARQDGKGETYAVDTLRASQKAWLVFRDAECRVESAPVGYMGSLDRYLYLSCLAAMADKRIDDLKELEKAYER